MKKNLFGLGLLLMIVLVACANSKKTTATGPKTEYVRMERTACFGTCPSYVVEVYKDGMVRYTSVHYTEYEGVYEKNLGAEKTMEVLKQFDEYRVDTCQNEYPQIIADLPGIINYIKYANGNKKHIYQAHFGPDFLKTLARNIDSISQVNTSWKKVKDIEKQ